MQQRGLEPNAITLNAEVSACEKVKQPKQDFQLFEGTQRRDVDPNVSPSVLRSTPA